jgi:uncharacterized protein DUF6455
MNILPIIIIVSILLAFAILLIRLTLTISGNIKTGKRFREKLLDRLNQLPIKKMIGRRDIDVDKYLHNVPMTDIENQLRNCDKCAVKEECEETLEKEETSKINYSFCPNDEGFKEIKYMKIASSTTNGNDEK